MLQLNGTVIRKRGGYSDRGDQPFCFRRKHINDNIWIMDRSDKKLVLLYFVIILIFILIYDYFKKVLTSMTIWLIQNMNFVLSYRCSLWGCKVIWGWRHRTLAYVEFAKCKLYLDKVLDSTSRTRRDGSVWNLWDRILHWADSWRCHRHPTVSPTPPENDNSSLLLKIVC